MRSSPESRRCRLDELPFSGFRQKWFRPCVCGYGTGQLCLGSSSWLLVKQIILLQRIHASEKTVKPETKLTPFLITEMLETFAGEDFAARTAWIVFHARLDVSRCKEADQGVLKILKYIKWERKIPSEISKHRQNPLYLLWSYTVSFTCSVFCNSFSDGMRHFCVSVCLHAVRM